MIVFVLVGEGLWLVARNVVQQRLVHTLEALADTGKAIEVVTLQVHIFIHTQPVISSSLCS